MSEELDPAQLDQELEQQDQRSEQMFQEGRLRSALRVSQEVTRQARSHGRVIHYMRGLFDQMRFGHGILAPQITVDAAVELIALLNDEEQARRIQPDLDEGHYQWVCQWMSSCAYDNLSEATGNMNGYNSVGMHECIADGIQVCRQTGKMECIKCFREYASDVYLASDDLEMVLHQCDVLLEYRGKDVDSKDRRWSGLKKRAWIKLLNGDLSGAIEDLTQADQLSQAEEVYLKLHAKLHVAADLDEALLLAGLPRYPWSAEPPLTPWIPEQGEWPEFELERARGEALACVVSGDVDSGIKILTQWDQLLTQQKCQREWFEIRLRLIAAYLIAQKRTRAESLAKGLEAQAAESQDFLTLRRLKRLMDPMIDPVPVPTLSAMQSGPYGQHPVTSSEAADGASQVASATTVSSTPKADEEDENTPLREFIEGIMARILEARQQTDETASTEALSGILAEILQFSPQAIESPRDGATLLHISRWVLAGPEDARRVWNFGIGLVQRFPDDATTLNVCADLGAHFRNLDATAFADVAEEELEQMFRKSLALNTERPRNYLRAGEYFVQRDDLGEAERCFARAFRLDRTEGTAAIQLANVYRETDRPRDALAALDLCLREGSENADVAWEAALAAYGLEQFDSQLTYLDRHLELGEPHLWVEYYRAWALLELKRYPECLAAIAAEIGFDPPGMLHLQILRACAYAGTGDRAAAASEIQSILKTRFATIDYLSMSGIVRNFGRLCAAVADWPQDDPIRMALMQRMLATGLMPDAYFEEQRAQIPEQTDVSFFRVRLRQPLPPDWADSDGCLPSQTDWKSYDIEWGVLAKSEQEAADRVLTMHYAAVEEPAEILQLEAAGEGYEERPGVVWQGFRWYAEGTDGESDDLDDLIPDLDAWTGDEDDEEEDDDE